MSYTKIEGRFPSSDKRHEIPYYVCTPDGTNPKGIVQILHGMGESSASYEQNGLVKELCAGGYVVCASDHLGHGGTVEQEAEQGDIKDMELLLRDARQLRKILQTKYRHLPYFFLGHSMGSFLLRDYINRYPDEIDGAILSGTFASDSNVRLAKLISKFLCLLGLGKKPSKLMQKIVFENLKQPGEEHKKPTGRGFTARGYFQLFSIMEKISDETAIQTMPCSVPILMVSGENDPLGGMGEGLKQLYNLYFEAGVDDLTLKLYPNIGHGVLSEPGKETVFQDVIQWLDAECEHFCNDRVWNPIF